MIRSFQHRGLKRLYERGDRSGIRPDLLETVELIDYHVRRRKTAMPMKNPVHPGRIVRHDCLEPLGLSVAEGAKILGVTRQALNNVITGKSAISPQMAIRLTKAFGSTEETWLRMQLAYDLAVARKDESKIKVRRQQVPQELQMH